MEAALSDWRCACGRLLARVALNDGSVAQVKCERCGALNTLQIRAAVPVAGRLQRVS